MWFQLGGRMVRHPGVEAGSSGILNHNRHLFELAQRERLRQMPPHAITRPPGQ